MIRGIVISLLVLTLCLQFRPSLQPTKVNLTDFMFSHQKQSVCRLLQSADKVSALQFTVCLLLAGDIEMNPGPQTIYLCALCDLEVTWSDKAICCDGCNVWIHHSCVNMNSIEYSLIGRSAVPWHRPRCDNINCDTFTFNSFELSCYNSYSPLSRAPSDSGSIYSAQDPFSPKCTSSPKPPTLPNRTSSPSQPVNRTNSTNGNDQSSVFDLPKKSNLRILNINCQSLKSKRSELQAVIEYVKPDIVCATETWLRGIKPGKPPTSDLISSSEIFPDSYNVFRNDRNTLGGGVLIMAHKSLTAEEQPQLVTDCEINWLKLKLLNQKDLFIGVFYMPHRNQKDINEFNKSLSLLSQTGTKDIIIAGDLNCPDINWDSCTVSSSASDRQLQQELADVTSSAALTQVHTQPTRLSAILDVIFTTNPTLLKNSTSAPGISDHDLVIADFNTKPQLAKEKPCKFLKFNKANWNQIEQDLKDLLPI